MDYSDNIELAALLPGFESRIEEVNGTSFHYVTGGKGKPLFLLPGWPQTWWAFHKIMPALAKNNTVIAVDLRGMGASGKSMERYSKKEMAQDILSLAQKLGFQVISIAGHDIGSNVAISFAGHFPRHIDKLIVMDTPHPDYNMYKLPILPIGAPVYPWWVAFNQVKDLPEELLEGRFHLVQNWIFDELLEDQTAISEFDRTVYAVAYDSKDAIRASNAWYQTFGQDIIDLKSMPQISARTLAMGSNQSIEILKQCLPAYIVEPQYQVISNSGHFIQEEQPLQVVEVIKNFLESE